MKIRNRYIQRFRLRRYVTKQHGDQKRKYTGKPYVTHLFAVARIVKRYNIDHRAVEIALCHDLLEDTNTSARQLLDELERIGYSTDDAYFIVKRVIDLTDVYTHEAHPDKNRKERKRLEVERLANVHYVSQSIKYADLIDNTSSIMKHDPDFAVVYLKEKERLLAKMKDGHEDLYQRAFHNLKG